MCRRMYVRSIILMTVVQFFTTGAVLATEPAPPENLTEIKATHSWRIAFIPKFKYLGKTGKLSSYWQPAWDAAQKAGEDFGVEVSLVTSNMLGNTDAEYVEPQIRLVVSLIAEKKVDGLIIAPFDGDRLAPVVDKAVASGIPTVVMDTPLNSDKALTFVSYNNEQAGRMMGEWVVRRLGGGGKVLILDGPQNQQCALDRRKGFLAGLQAGSVEILGTKAADWEIEPANRITAGWLKEFRDVRAIIAANDNMAIGAAQAVAAAGRKGITITGCDATDAGLADVAAGWVAATIDLASGKLTRLALLVLVRHLENGESFPPVIFMSDAPLVTKENMGNVTAQRTHKQPDGRQ